MEDSPLSITASVAGILTFIAAITTFIYVRYQILQNGFDEIVSIIEATYLGLEETNSLALSLSQNDESHRDEILRRCLLDLQDNDNSILDLLGVVVGQQFLQNFVTFSKGALSSLAGGLAISESHGRFRAGFSNSVIVDMDDLFAAPKHNRHCTLIVAVLSRAEGCREENSPAGEASVSDSASANASIAFVGYKTLSSYI